MHNYSQHLSQGDYFEVFTQFTQSNLFHQFFRCAKDIDTLIESLPNEDSSQELQAQSLRRLEIENQEAAKQLEEVIRHHWLVFSFPN